MFGSIFRAFKASSHKDSKSYEGVVLGGTLERENKVNFIALITITVSLYPAGEYHAEGWLAVEFPMVAGHTGGSH